jgi:hypothetical protein
MVPTAYALNRTIRRPNCRRLGDGDTALSRYSEGAAPADSRQAAMDLRRTP